MSQPDPPRSGPDAGAPADVLAFLRGTWRVRRQLTDHRSGQAGDFVGHAWFRPAGQPDTLVYEEQGELCFGGHRGPASRTLRYAGRADRTVEVRFADGRWFYLLDARTGNWRAEHACAADSYTVTGWVRASQPDRFEERWHARGPAKDYELVSAYTRVG
jgi:hypothetical protein